MTSMDHADELGRVTLIVPAAGTGSRFGDVKPKQYIHLAGKPLLGHTLARLALLDFGRIVLVVGEGDSGYRDVEEASQCEIVIGGATRAESVLNGLRYIDAAANDWVMVHDAARPCIRAEDILRLYRAASTSHVGGILTIPVSDTVKTIDAGLVTGTVDRTALALAQTPQMFRYGLLLGALESAKASGEEVTDEASAVELAGYQPVLVEGSADNIKVTTRADLALAEFYLASQDSSAKGNCA